MRHSKKFAKFYQTDLGKELFHKVCEVISTIVYEKNKKILFIGYANVYMPLFIDNHVYMLCDLNKDFKIRFDKIFVFHHTDYKEKDLLSLFSGLEKSLVDGGEIVFLASKMYSMKLNKIVFNLKTILLEHKITSKMKKCDFFYIKKIPILSKYLNFLNIPCFARFIIIHAKTDSRCKISIGKFEPVS